MVSLHVTTIEIQVGLSAAHAQVDFVPRNHKRIESDGALRPAGVDLVDHLLQIGLGRRLGEALGRPPQQRGAAEVNEGAVEQHVVLVLHGQTLLLGGARLAQREHAAADGHLAPQAAWRAVHVHRQLVWLLGEAAIRVHDQHAVGRQTVDFTPRLPLGCSLLQQIQMNIM
jgi:hypothetical protein